jgi:hypothetical protein
MTTKAKVKTKAAYTPGPWYDQNAWGERINIRDEASDYVLAVVDDGGHVDPEFSLDWEVMVANGRLMAAAPDLYEALLYIVTSNCLTHTAQKMAAEALAKARNK